MDIEESGEILFKDDRHLKWSYLDPDVKIFLMEKDNYRFYDEENEQLTIGKIKNRSRQWIWQLFFSDSLSPHTRGNEEERKLYIKNEDADDPLDIEVHLDTGYLPAKVIQEDTRLGVRIVYIFSDYKKNVEVPADAFELSVPDDVEIIDEDAGESFE